MKKKSSNVAVDYEELALSDAASVKFSKSVDITGTTIYGAIVKAGAEVGNVSYSSKGDYMNTCLKPFDVLTTEEVNALYSLVPQCISEQTETN